MLIQRTYPNGIVNPRRIRIGMEYGGMLRANYEVFVQQGRLLAGLDGTEGRLAEWGAYLATHGTVGQFGEIAAEVISGCP